MSYVKGMLCPACGNDFKYIDARNRSLGLSGSCECPYCDTRLQYPSHLRGIGIYIRLAFVTLSVLLLFVFLIMLISENTYGIILAIPIGWITIRYRTNYFKRNVPLKDGVIPMVMVDD